VQFSPASHHFIPLGSKYSPMHCVPKYPAVILVLSFAFIVQVSLTYKSAGTARVLSIFILVCFWTFDGLKITFKLLALSLIS
jgi:Zn-dependent protease